MAKFDVTICERESCFLTPLVLRLHAWSLQKTGSAPSALLMTTPFASWMFRRENCWVWRFSESSFLLTVTFVCRVHVFWFIQGLRLLVFSLHFICFHCISFRLMHEMLGHQKIPGCPFECLSEVESVLSESLDRIGQFWLIFELCDENAQKNVDLRMRVCLVTRTVARRMASGSQLVSLVGVVSSTGIWTWWKEVRSQLMKLWLPQRSLLIEINSALQQFSRITSNKALVICIRPVAWGEPPWYTVQPVKCWCQVQGKASSGYDSDSMQHSCNAKKTALRQQREESSSIKTQCHKRKQNLQAENRKSQTTLRTCRKLHHSTNKGKN